VEVSVWAALVIDELAALASRGPNIPSSERLFKKRFDA